MVTRESEMPHFSDPSDFGDFYNPELADRGNDERDFDRAADIAYENRHLCDEHALLGLLILKHDYLVAGNMAMADEMERRAAVLRSRISAS